jgi:YD repeat-containing protein
LMFSVYLLSAYHLCFLRHIKHAIYTYDAAGNRIKAVESVLQPPTPTPTPTATPTATPTPTPTVTPTATPADLIFADSFESGDFSAWSYYTPSGDLFVDTAARIVGNYGLRNVVDNNGARFVQDDTPGGESSYHARFYFDPNSIQMNSGNHVIFQGYKYNGMELPAAVVRVEVGKDKDTGLYQVRAAIRKNNNDWIFSPAYTFSDYHHAFEIRWRAGTGIARPDGVLQFWLDGELKYSQTNVDNHTHRVDFARLGVVEPPDVGTAGSHCLDHFESRQNSYIGLADPGFGFVCLDHSQGASEERTSEAEGPRTSGAEGPRTSGAEGPRTGEAEVPRTGEAEVPRTEWGAGRQPGILTGELLFADGFESGDLSAWDGYTDDPYLSVTTAAALIGVYGLSVRVDTGYDDEPRTAVVRDETPDGETIYQARFYLDPHGLDLNGGNHTILRGELGAGVVVLALDLGSQPEMDDYQLFVSARLVDEEGLPGDWLSSPAFTITDGPQVVEIGWGAASAEGVDDGWLRLWLDGELVYEHVEVSNYGLALERVELGAVHAPLPGASGVYCLDEFASARGGYIGVGDGPVACGEGEAAGDEDAQRAGWLPRVWTGTLDALRRLGAEIAGLLAASEAWLFATPQPALAAPVGEGRSSPLFQGGVVTTTISYSYDPLHRLVAADYSSGESHIYTYDPVGNVTAYDRTLGGNLVTTTYTYDAANQLLTAQASNEPTIWYYQYDANGSLTEVTPDSLPPADGARRYSYNAAGYLRKVEIHDGAGYQVRAEMSYDGLGGRLSQTAYEGGTSLTTHYTLDSQVGQRPLVATPQGPPEGGQGGQSTHYLYGHGPLGERAAGWALYLPDGTDSVRQLAGMDGQVTLTRRFSPWGELLEQDGGGDFAWGYFGGLLDAATGLIYVGGGQYYDPVTGRFLTRQGPGRDNPYVPWGRDPLGALLGPVALLIFLHRRRRKPGRYDQILVGLVLLLAVGAGLAACGDGGGPSAPGPSPLPPTQPPGASTPTYTAPPQTGTPVGTPAGSPGPSPTVTLCTPTGTKTVTPTNTRTLAPSPTTTLPPTIGPVPTKGGVANVPHWQETVERYVRIRQVLEARDPAALTDVPSDPDGFGKRLKNEYLLAFYISAEFDTLVQKQSGLKSLALAALYSNYRSVCGGNCDSVMLQVNWLSASEGWYGATHSDDNLLTFYRRYAPNGLALEVMNGKYTHPLASRWGNYKAGSKLDAYINRRGEADWWTGNGEPYLGYDDEKLRSPQYAGFVIMSTAQNTACNAVRCLGW